METPAKEKVSHAIRQCEDKNKPFYKYILVDLDDVTIIIDRLGRNIKKQIADSSNKKIKMPKLYAFATKVSDEIEANCKRVNFEFFVKPSKIQMLDQFRHMAVDEEDEFGNKIYKPKVQAMPQPGDDEEDDNDQE